MENINQLEQVILQQLQVGNTNVIGVALTLYDESENNPNLRTLLRNMTSEEINRAFLQALLPY